jgi:hypothetical protein
MNRKHKGILIDACGRINIKDSLQTKWWTLCGTYGYLTYGSWKGVDCKRCLQKKER